MIPLQEIQKTAGYPVAKAIESLLRRIRDLEERSGLSSSGSASSASSTTALDDPTAQVSLAAVSGSASTAMRSDAAPALNVSISPVWGGNHAFSNDIAANADVVIKGGMASPVVTIGGENTDQGTIDNATGGELFIRTGGTDAIEINSSAQAVVIQPFGLQLRSHGIIGYDVNHTYSGRMSPMAMVTPPTDDLRISAGDIVDLDRAAFEVSADPAGTASYLASWLQTGSTTPEAYVQWDGRFITTGSTAGAVVYTNVGNTFTQKQTMNAGVEPSSMFATLDKIDILNYYIAVNSWKHYVDHGLLNANVHLPSVSSSGGQEYVIYVLNCGIEDKCDIVTNGSDTFADDASTSKEMFINSTIRVTNDGISKWYFV